MRRRREHGAAEFCRFVVALDGTRRQLMMDLMRASTHTALTRMPSAIPMSADYQAA